ncbi:MAG: Selenocysteine-specific elongation factor [Anaerolineales bacterium]|nr:Selenocysteine-specific elongation factor [Anaerolineales bacterium]
MRVIGTAGHVDHGKSTLIEALTGIDPDRLQEEKERGLTIDLGFAWITLPSGQTASIVDVPGHEDFIKNMLAGVGGIDVALLVVAADEGPMPQTREHLAILDLLEVKNGLVALTKIDLTPEPDWLDLVAAETEDLLAPTSLAGAPIVRVSSRTGDGLEDVRHALDDLLVATPPRRDVGRPRLPVDRAFTVAGFGTIVTGTLIDGHFAVGDVVDIQPEGLDARIRGLQTHKQKIETAVPGSRVAINLSGVGVDDLERGAVVTTPGWLRGTRLIDVRLRMMAEAPKPLKHNIEVEVFAGAAQVMARTRVLGEYEIAPGETGWAQLRLASPIAVAKNDRFIIRQPSPSRTLGGGIIVDPHPRRRHRRFQDKIIDRLEAMASDTPADILLGTLFKQEPIEARRAVRRSQLELANAAAALDELLEKGDVIILDSGPTGGERLARSSLQLISAGGWSRLTDRTHNVLAEYHATYPLRQGMPQEELRSRLRLDGQLVNAIIARASEEDQIVADAGTLRLPSHQVAFSAKQQKHIDAVLAVFRQEPYTPPSTSDVETQVGPEVLYALLEQGQLTQVSEDVLFLTETYAEMVERVTAYIRREDSITVAQARDMLETSRKYALALLEHLDEERITKRVADERVLA